jgi:hypothetical protein
MLCLIKRLFYKNYKVVFVIAAQAAIGSWRIQTKNSVPCFARCRGGASSAPMKRKRVHRLYTQKPYSRRQPRWVRGNDKFSYENL